MTRSAPLLIVASATALAGCVNVSAPEKPIEINLNINVKQEVIVRLQQDAQDLITKNPELFPQ
jgi:lipoprotein NlpI